MSRIGKKLIQIPDGVEVKISDNEIVVRGPKGELKQEIHPHVNVIQEEKQIRVSVKSPDDKKDRALWGLYTSLIKNMIEGVIKGFEKKLELVGVGYRVALAGDKLTLNVGYSHPVDFQLPEGITASVEKNTIVISGIDKQLVGETAARIRSVRKPEPYKGKGIKYSDEVVRRKAGKTAKTGDAG